MGQKGSRLNTPPAYGLQTHPATDDDSMLDLLPRFPAWARRPSLVSPEARLREEEELNLLAAEVQHIVASSSLKGSAAAPASTLAAVHVGDAAQRQRGLFDRLRPLMNRRPSVVSFVAEPLPLAQSSSEAAEFLYDMGKRILLGREGGFELQRNPRRAIHLLQRAAELGHVGAKWDLHCCRGEGENITLDYARAVVLYARFAKMGHPVALSNLGVCYHKGRGVKKCLSKAVRYYERAAALNYARGNYNLAVCYDLGEGVKQDSVKAVEHYRLSAEQGYAVAQYYTGVCFNNAKGMEGRDFTKAIDMWVRAARQGHGLAQLVLGNFYREGDEPLFPQDALKAALLFRSAVGWGDEKAWARLKELLADNAEADFEEIKPQAPSTNKTAGEAPQPQQQASGAVSLVPSLYDQCCLHYFRQWTEQPWAATSAEVKAAQARLPAEVVERVNRDVRKCHNPNCTRLHFGPGAVQRRWRLRPARAVEETEAGSTDPRPERAEQQQDGKSPLDQLELEGEGTNGDELTLHFCSFTCASSL